MTSYMGRISLLLELARSLAVLESQTVIDAQQKVAPDSYMVRKVAPYRRPSSQSFLLPVIASKLLIMSSGTNLIGNGTLSGGWGYGQQSCRPKPRGAGRRKACCTNLHVALCCTRHKAQEGMLKTQKVYSRLESASSGTRHPCKIMPN